MLAPLPGTCVYCTRAHDVHNAHQLDASPKDRLIIIIFINNINNISHLVPLVTTFPKNFSYWSRTMSCFPIGPEQCAAFLLVQNNVLLSYWSRTKCCFPIGPEQSAAFLLVPNNELGFLLVQNNELLSYWSRKMSCFPIGPEQ